MLAFETKTSSPCSTQSLPCVLGKVTPLSESEIPQGWPSSSLTAACDWDEDKQSQGCASSYEQLVHACVSAYVCECICVYACVHVSVRVCVHVYVRGEGEEDIVWLCAERAELPGPFTDCL